MCEPRMVVLREVKEWGWVRVGFFVISAAVVMFAGGETKALSARDVAGPTV